MSHPLKLTVSAVLALGFSLLAAPASAGLAESLTVADTAPLGRPVTRGPYSDLKSYFPQEHVVVGYKTWLNAYYQNDFIAAIWVPDGFQSSRYIQGIGYATSNSGNFSKGTIVFTTIYGADLNPMGSDLAVTGYDAETPQAKFYDENFVGKSGKKYPAGTAELVKLSDLPRRLGSGFDLHPFVGDPNSLVYIFQTTVPAKDTGSPEKGLLLKEDFTGAFHMGPFDEGHAFNPGELPGTEFRVVEGNVDVFGVLNGSRGRCLANPRGNCLDLIGDVGVGRIESTRRFNLDPAYTYTIEFTADSGDSGGNQPLSLAASIGSFEALAEALQAPKNYRMTFTPDTAQPNVSLDFRSIGNVDNFHGPVLSNIKMCSHPVGSLKLACP